MKKNIIKAFHFLSEDKKQCKLQKKNKIKNSNNNSACDSQILVVTSNLVTISRNKNLVVILLTYWDWTR